MSSPESPGTESLAPSTPPDVASPVALRTSRGDVAISLGQLKLSALAESHERVGARVGASKQLVGDWRSGRKTPGHPNRAAIEREWPHIKARDWDLSPAESDVADAPPDLDVDALDGDQLSELIAHARTQRSAPSASATVAAKWSAIEMRGLELLERRKSDRQKALESAEWQTNEAALLDALRRHPLAMIDVLRRSPHPMPEFFEREIAAWRERNAALVSRAESVSAELAAVSPWCRKTEPLNPT